MSTVPTGRDNGLPSAPSYVALVDVDPPVADHVLELLRDAGIPAVAEPLGGERGPYQDVRPPPQPTERIHVERARIDSARELVARTLPSLRADFHADAARRVDAAVMRAADVEQAFAAIVSSYDTPVGPVGPWPVLEDDDSDTDAERQDPAGRAEPADRPTGSGLSSRLARRHDDPDPSYWPEEHFVPPVPPRLPRLDRVSRFAWTGVFGGPMLLLLIVVFNVQVDRVVTFAALAAFIAGFATLVVRMPDTPPDDDTRDDGAVV